MGIRIFCKWSQKIKWFVPAFSLFIIFILAIKYQQEFNRFGLNDFGYLPERIGISESACPIPRLDPWHKSVYPFVSLPSGKLTCTGSQPELSYISEKGKLMVDLTEASKQGYRDLKCKFRCFDRNFDDKNLTWLSWHKFPISGLGTTVSCEFINVECNESGSKVYTNLHFVLQPNQTRVDQILTNKRLPRQHNVIIFILDSLSHSHFVRMLPKTQKVLQQLYGFTFFDGMVKIGDNSYPNAVSFLTGIDPRNISSTDYYNRYLDHMNFVWKDFSKSGYLTYFEEDFAIRDTFNYVKMGFKQKPTDHYLRAFWLAIYHNYSSSYWSIANDFLFQSSRMCFGNNKKHSIMLNHFSQFLIKYNTSIPKFAFIWNNEMLHEFINDIGYADDDLANFFSSHFHLFNDSFLFVMGDHGHRISGIRNTPVGQFELRMPLFAMHVPLSLRQKNPQLLKVFDGNSKLLSSFYDIYVTLRDILDSQSSSSWDFSTQSDWLAKFGTPIGQSLLRPLPKDRLCPSAGIPEEFCICQAEVPVNITDNTVIQAGKVIVDRVNELLRNRTECAKLNFVNVTSALRFEDYGSFKQKNGPDTKINKYRITVAANPSGALLESTIKMENNRPQVIGFIQRANRYGNQSICVDDSLLKNYCYCI